MLGSKSIVNVQRAGSKLSFHKYYTESIANAPGKVTQLWYLIKWRFLFLGKQIFPFFRFFLKLPYQAHIPLQLSLLSTKCPAQKNCAGQQVIKSEQYSFVCVLRADRLP